MSPFKGIGPAIHSPIPLRESFGREGGSRLYIWVFQQVSRRLLKRPSPAASGPAFIHAPATSRVSSRIPVLTSQVLLHPPQIRPRDSTSAQTLNQNDVSELMIPSKLSALAEKFKKVLLGESCKPTSSVGSNLLS